MTTKQKKSRAAGRFGARYGKTVKANLNKVEDIQRKKQTCPFCKRKGAKRLSKGIWQCSKKGCSKKFADAVYYLK